MQKMEPAKIGLADAIENLRQELTEASRRGEGKELRFNVDAIELELAVELAAEGGGGGKVSFNVLGVGAEVGGEGKLSRSNAHRVTVKLKPAAGSSALVSDKVPGPPR